MSLPKSALRFSSHLISLYTNPLSIPLLAILAPCTDLTSYILHYLFALSTQAQEHYLFALSTQAAQEHFSPGHLHCHNQCILYHRVRPILASVTTPLLVKMFSLCVCELYKLNKLLDDLKFPSGLIIISIYLFIYLSNWAIRYNGPFKVEVT